MRGTKGTETSKYLQEKKEKSISPVAASEKERAQTKNLFLGLRTGNMLQQILIEAVWKDTP